MSGIESFYSFISEDYQGVLARFGNGSVVERFVKKYYSDTTFERLSSAFATSDVKSAFIYAHTLKGIAQNLGFGEFGRVASELTEILRKGSFDGTKELFEKVENCQKKVVEGIEKYLK